MIILCDNIKSFTLQNLEFKLHREGDVLVITIHNLQKTKVKFINIMECINLSSVSPAVICRFFKDSGCFRRYQSLCLHKTSLSECSMGKSCKSSICMFCLFV
jgi:hypothetical protein